jgi:hypothetical protein
MREENTLIVLPDVRSIGWNVCNHSDCRRITGHIFTASVLFTGTEHFIKTNIFIHLKLFQASRRDYIMSLYEQVL